jgi:predicted transcriptional regulator
MFNGTHYPTFAELPILRALWAMGTATNREVVAHMERDEGLYYESNAPTVMLRSLVAKELVAREAAPVGTRGHVYAARLTREDFAAMIVGEIDE